MPTPRELHLYYDPDTGTADLVVVYGLGRGLSLLGPATVTYRHTEAGADVNHIVDLTAAFRDDAEVLRYVRESTSRQHPRIAA